MSTYCRPGRASTTWTAPDGQRISTRSATLGAPEAKEHARVVRRQIARAAANLAHEGAAAGRQRDPRPNGVAVARRTPQPKPQPPTDICVVAHRAGRSLELFTAISKSPSPSRSPKAAPRLTCTVQGPSRGRRALQKCPRRRFPKADCAARTRPPDRPFPRCRTRGHWPRIGRGRRSLSQSKNPVPNPKKAMLAR